MVLTVLNFHVVPVKNIRQPEEVFNFATIFFVSEINGARKTVENALRKLP